MCHEEKYDSESRVFAAGSETLKFLLECDYYLLQLVAKWMLETFIKSETFGMTLTLF